MGPDLIDKPLAWAHFYKEYRSAVLFAHTLLAHLAVAVLTVTRFRTRPLCRCLHRPYRPRPHLVLSATFYWPLRVAHVWGKRSEQEEIGKAYWIAFTAAQSCGPGSWAVCSPSPGLSGVIASTARMLDFLLTGKARRQGE